MNGYSTADMVGKLARMRYDVLLPLLQDLPVSWRRGSNWKLKWALVISTQYGMLQATTRMLLGMKDLLPGVNISLFVSRW
jgi:hypothetical protein